MTAAVQGGGLSHACAGGEVNSTTRLDGHVDGFFPPGAGFEKVVAKQEPRGSLNARWRLSSRARVPRAGGEAPGGGKYLLQEQG